MQNDISVGLRTIPWHYGICNTMSGTGFTNFVTNFCEVSELLADSKY